eukprot:m.63262 g.63262  ORF g.63262 m.63262 type:complete len:284 (-) comp7183_c0_seq2:103-954(-)
MSAACLSLLMATITLNDGNTIPQLGLGVYLAGADGETYDAVSAALRDGYRHIDTAAIYRNEADVGRAVRDSGIPRSEIFVTTKFWANSGHGFEEVQKACRVSLSRLGLEYVDLYLVHSPGAADAHGRAETWRGMEKLKADGLARSIGVSNYGLLHLQALLQTAAVVPAVNQVELSPFRNVPDVAAFCKEHGIALEAYSPLTKGERIGDPRLARIAEKYKKTPAQILIRYCIENGWIVIPKSTRPARIHENGDVFDFRLSVDDVILMQSWEENLVTGWDPMIAP